MRANAGLTLINSAPDTRSVITGGYMIYEDGGGIYNRGTLTIQAADGGEIAIVNNCARNGGGIYSDDNATLNIQGGRIENNTAFSSGGGIYSRGILTVDGTVITHCTASWSGGGIYSEKALAMSGGALRYNSAPSGGGISNAGSMTLSNNPVIQYNTASQVGGGIDLKGELAIAGGKPVITQNTVLGKPNNIFIHTGKLIDITGYMRTGALIGVTLQSNEGQVTRGAYTNGNELNYKRYYLGINGDEYWSCEFRTSSGEWEIGLLTKKSDYVTNKPFLEQTQTPNPLSPNEVDATNWMAAIRDDRYLYEINQVYSHDSNTYDISKDRSIGSFADITKDWYYYAICQEESLRGQMEDGVRLFDIRLNNVHCKTYNYWGAGWTWGEEGDGALYITHGKKQKAGTYYCQYDGKDLTLSVILDWVKDFLTEHPTETIMLSFTAETFQMDEYHDRIFTYLREHLEKLAHTINPSTGESFLYREPGTLDYFARYTKYPQLGDCRGKVFIMVDEERELDFVGSMIPTPDFAPVRQEQPGNNQIHADEKIKNVQTFLNVKINVPNPVMVPMGSEHLDVYYQIALNSHTEKKSEIVMGKHSPRAIYQEVNPTFFGPGKAFDQRGKYVGWIKMDGVTRDYSRYIWQSNFPDNYDVTRKITVKSGINPAYILDAEDVYPDQNYTVWAGEEITFPGKIYTLPDVYSFQGWRVTDSQGAKVYQPGDTYAVKEDVTIEGVWTYQVESSVRVHLAGGSGMSFITYADVGSNLDLSDIEQPTKSGYTLVGWANENGTLDADKTITRDLIDMDENGNPITTEVDENGNSYNVITLEPVWEANTDTVTVIYEPGAYGTTVPESTTITLNDTLVFPPAPAASSAYRYFDGWELKKDPARRFAAGQVLVFADWDFVSGTADNPQLVFEATWGSQRRSLLTFDTTGGSIVDPFSAPAGTQISEPEAPYRVGYTFTGWLDEDGKPVTWPYTMPQQGATLTATWTVNSYTISFVTPEDATQLDPITVPYDTPLSTVKIPKPVRPHYRMYDWAPQLPATMPAEDLVLTAHWRPYEYGMEFNANGGIWSEPDGGEPDTLSVVGRYGDNVPVIPDPTWEGHSFEGWQIDYIYRDGEKIQPEVPGEIVQIPETYPDENIYYIAKWSEHIWAIPDYSWADDFSSVTATRACLDEESLTETETVKTTTALSTAPTCTTRGETTYTAEFTNPAFETVTLTIRDVDALGHDFGEGVVTRPATETEPGEMTWTCKNDPSHVLMYEIPVTWDASTADFVIPFPVIEEEAFAGIAATHIEVQPNVEFIGPRAFADCPNLRKIHIPDSVTNVDDTALDGCQDVIVCGGTAAEYLAYINDFTFVQEPAE